MKYFVSILFVSTVYLGLVRAECKEYLGASFEEICKNENLMNVAIPITDSAEKYKLYTNGNFADANCAPKCIDLDTGVCTDNKAKCMDNIPAYLAVFKEKLPYFRVKSRRYPYDQTYNAPSKMVYGKHFVVYEGKSKTPYFSYGICYDKEGGECVFNLNIDVGRCASAQAVQNNVPKDVQQEALNDA